jgi:acyl-CoA reductase-like NAD-dependent aldehyde dehydrogenase
MSHPGAASPPRAEIRELLRIGSARVDTMDRIEVRNPATGDVIGTCASATAAMAADGDALSTLVTLEVGKPLEEARGEVEYAAEFARWYAEEARRIYGRTTTGGSTGPWRHLLRQPVGIVGDVFSSDPRVRKISFTGSVSTGKKLMESAARTLTKVGFELGGNNAFIVFEDADLEAAVAAAVIAKLRNGGQTCVCANRYLVHESVLAEFACRFASALDSKRLGSGLEPATDIGPLIEHRAVSRIQQGVDNAVASGATVVCGGRPVSVAGLPDAPFYPPTVLTGVSPGSSIVTEEIFGPVAPRVRNSSPASSSSTGLPLQVLSFRRAASSRAASGWRAVPRA